jgi:hypothetical protein
MVELMACEVNYKSLSIVIINSYINDNYESPMNQPINNNGSMLSQGVNLTFSNFRGLRISRADGAGDLSNFHFIGYNIGDVNYSFRGPYL